MAIAGLLNTTDFDTPSGRRPQNFREGILRLYPRGGQNKALLTALTAVMKSKSTNDPVYHWFTKQMQDRRLKLSANLAAGADTAGDTESVSIDSSFASAFGVKAGDVLYAEHTGEILRVMTTPTAAGTLSVQRGFTQEAGSAVSLVDYDGAGVNPYLKVIGSSFEEGSYAPDPVSFAMTELYNSLQIFRSTYGLTNTAAATHTRTGSEEAELKREALEIFGMDIEMALWFGRRSVSVLNGNPLRTTDGVLSFIPAANRLVPEDGIITPDVFDAWSTDIFRYGSEEKMVFAGNQLLTAISRMVRKSGDAKYELSGQVSEYGIGGIRKLTTPNGTLVLKNHPLFSQMTGGTNGGSEYTSMANAGVVLDMSNLVYRYLDGRDIQFQPNLQAIGEDSKKAGFIGELGLELHHPSTHFYIGGVTSGRDDPADV